MTSTRVISMMPQTSIVMSLKTLSKDKNAAFDFCEAEYFLALKEGKVVGRVAAIINNKANEKWDKKDVRFGLDRLH